MITKNEIFPVGQINKPHGIGGEMSFSFSTDVFDSEEAPFFIVEIQGIFVPFYLEDYRFKTDSTGILKFDGIDNENEARDFSGLTIYLPKTYLDKTEDTEISLEYFIGFQVEENGQNIGIIEGIDESTENVLFIVEDKNGKEILLPAIDEFITEIDHDNKTLHLDLPEGLLDL